MIKYVIKRLLLMIPVILCVIILVFTVMYLVPGDPAALIIGANATEEQLEATREELGLNDPYFVQLFRYISKVVRFDFGKSYITEKSVSEEIVTRFPYTFRIAFLCMILSLVVGIPLGITAAMNQGKAGDTFSMLVALFGISMPPFWVGLMLVLLFSVHLGWLPSFGIKTAASYVLPVITTSLTGIAQQARQTRSSMLEVMRSDYIITARAKGLSRRKIIWKHMLPNAMIPLITVAGTTFGRLIGGMVVTEVVFSIPGLGSHMIASVSNRDVPMVEGCVLAMAVSFSLIMLCVDLLYAFIDPRIKAQYAKKGGKKNAKQ